LAKEGLFFLPNYNNQPPKHLTTYFDDVIEFVSFLSNRQSGAVGLPNVIVWAYYFWKKDVENGYYLKDPDTYLRQAFQKFIYRLNQPFLRIDQTAFTNVSIFDRPYLEALFGGVEFPDGTLAMDQIEELIECQKVFMEVVSEIRSENMFTFPVISFSLYYKDGKFKDEDFARWASDHNIKWMDSNFFVSDNINVLSNCCRLLSSRNELKGFVNSIGGSGLSIGSCRVSTINLARIAYEALGYGQKTQYTGDKAKQRYLDILRDRTELDCKALYSMRHILQRNIEKGLLPNYQEGAVELDKQFCTIGILGLYEVMDLFGLINEDEFGYKSYSDEAIEFSSQIIDAINEVKDNFECDFSYNIEGIPAENCAGVICHADNLLYEQDKYYIYSNQ
jgi:ribonucleoside-triphosphate reductase (formate)